MRASFFKKTRMLRLNVAGMTVVELVMASSILVLLTSAVVLMLIRVFTVNRYALEQGVNTSQLQQSLRNITKALREARQSDAGGYMIELADDFELIFYADIDDDPATERVHYYLEDQEIKMGIAEASGFPPQYPVEDQEVKTVGSGIVNEASQPLFYYFDKNYPEEADPDNPVNPLATPASPEEISLIKIDIYANIDPTHTPNNMRMETFVRPRNISYQ